MAISLIKVGSKANTGYCEYVADTYSDLSNIPTRDLIFGTKCLVVETGKVYCLDSGLNWVLQKTKATLPDVTISDEGKVLTVDNTGAWVAAENSNSGAFYVNIVYDGVNTITSDKTFAEIDTAYTAGKTIIGIWGWNVSLMIPPEEGAYAGQFFRVDTINGTLSLFDVVCDENEEGWHGGIFTYQLTPTSEDAI